jgi:hypothetical protein
VTILHKNTICYHRELEYSIYVIDAVANEIDVVLKGMSMIRVDFGPISETVYIDIILNTIIERKL